MRVKALTFRTCGGELAVPNSPTTEHRRSQESHAPLPRLTDIRHGLGRHPALLVAPAAMAQQAGSTTRPADKPPVAQAWIDIATFASPGMPGGMAGMMMGGGGNSPLGALMGGGKAQGNQFGLTQAGGTGTLRGRHPAHAPQPEPVGGDPGRADWQPARPDTAAQGAAAGQAGAGDGRRFRRAAGRNAQGQDQAVLGLRHHRASGPAQGGRLLDRERHPARRNLQGTPRDAAGHPLGTGPAGLAQPAGPPPGARRAHRSWANTRSPARACRRISGSRCRQRRTSCRRSPCSNRRRTASPS